MNLTTIFYSFLILFLLIYFLLFISHLGEVNIPLLNRLIKKGYLKAKFRARDDLKVLKKIKEQKAFVNLGARVRIYFNKFRLNFFYYLALLFKSPRRSFVLINYDGEEKKYREKQYLEHLAKKRKLSIFSLYFLIVVIFSNFIIGLIVFQFSSVASDSYAYDGFFVNNSQVDWDPGTYSNVEVSGGKLALTYGPDFSNYQHQLSGTYFDTLGASTFNLTESGGLQSISDIASSGYLISTWVDSVNASTSWMGFSTNESTPSDSSIIWETRSCSSYNLISHSLTELVRFPSEECMFDGREATAEGIDYLDPEVLSCYGDTAANSTCCFDDFFINFNRQVTVSSVVIYSAEGAYPIDFDVYSHTDSGGNLDLVTSVTNNASSTIVLTFPPTLFEQLEIVVNTGNPILATSSADDFAVGEVEAYSGDPCLDWTPVTNGNIQSADNRYLQFRGKFNPSSDNTETPSVGEVNITADVGNVTYSPSGVYTSSVLDSTSTNSVWNNIFARATIFDSTSLDVSVRTGDTASPDGTWSGWSEVASSSSSMTNLASSAPVSASSEIDPALLAGAGMSSLLGTSEASVDGDVNTIWLSGENTSANGGSVQWVEIDLGSEKDVGYVSIQSMDNPGSPGAGYDFSPRNYTIQTWNGSSWVDQASTTNNSNYEKVGYSFLPVNTDKVKIEITKGNPVFITQVGYDLFGISEIEVGSSDFLSADLASTSARYLQYKLNLATNNTSTSPWVSEIRGEYSLLPEENGGDTGDDDSGTSTDDTDITETPKQTDPAPGGSTPPPPPPSQPTVQDPETGEEVVADFSVSIAPPADFTGDVPVVTSTSVNLSLEGGPDVVNMAISEDSEFSLASLIPYSKNYQFDLSSQTGIKTIYAKFYTNRGVSSQAVSCQVKLELPQTEIEEETTPIEEPMPEEEPVVEPMPEEEPVVEPVPEEEPVVEPMPEEEPAPELEEEIVEEPVEEEEIVEEEPVEEPTMEEEPTSEEKPAEGEIVEEGTAPEGGVEEPGEKKEEVIEEGGEEGLGVGEVWEREESMEADSGEVEDTEELFVVQTLDTLNKMLVLPAKKIMKNITESQAVKTAKKVAKAKATEASTKSVTGAYIVFSLIQLGAKAGSLNTVSYMFINMLGLFTFQRNRNYQIGTVYDSKTGQPVPYAKVEVVDKKGKIKESKITDKFGGYFFLVSPGEYSLITHRPGYKAISRPDTVYKTIYTPGKFMVFNKEGIINVDIPLEQKEKSKLSIFLEKINLDKILEIVFWVGLITIIAVTILNPTTWNYAMTASFVILGLLKYANYIRPKWGMVMDYNGQGMGFTIVEACEEANGSLVGRTVSDEKGRYALILNPGRYLLNILSPATKKQTKKLKQEKREIVAKKIKIEK